MRETGPGGLEHKFMAFEEAPRIDADCVIEGYASLFGVADRGGDIVARGAYRAGLERLSAEGRSVKMLWQHDPARPVGVWDLVEEVERGLRVRGRLLQEVRDGREAAALIGAGAIDGLSIGYRTVRAEKSGSGRILHEIDLWEVSLVTFPMLPAARLDLGGGDDPLSRSLADAFAEARARLD
ncbi:MAG: HK97 family phage prohead protease [Rubricella sp.]